MGQRNPSPPRCHPQSHLGKTGSLGRVYQTSPLFLPATDIFSHPSNNANHTIHPQQHRSSKIKKHKQDNSHRTKQKGSSFPYLEISQRKTPKPTTSKHSSSEISSVNCRYAKQRRKLIYQQGTPIETKTVGIEQKETVRRLTYLSQ